MPKKDNVLTIFSICLIISGSLTLGYLISEAKPKESDLLSIARHIANANEYDREDYNCVNFSQDLVSTLEDYGYDAKVVTGWKADNKYCKVGESEYLKGIPLSSVKDNDCLGAHAWVEVIISIEAVTGRIIR